MLVGVNAEFILVRLGRFVNIDDRTHILCSDACDTESVLYVGPTGRCVLFLIAIIK